MRNSEAMLKAFLELYSPLKDYGKMLLIQDAWEARDDEIEALRQELAATTERRDEWRSIATSNLAALQEATGRIAAMTKENERLQGVCHDYRTTQETMVGQLAASQAREAKLRDALELAMQICDAVPNRLQNHEEPSVAYIGTLVNEGVNPDTSACFGYYAHIRDALAMPFDDSPLQERLKQERERCEQACEKNGSSVSCQMAIRALT